jgi:hypothetical protein
MNLMGESPQRLRIAQKQVSLRRQGPHDVGDHLLCSAWNEIHQHVSAQNNIELFLARAPAIIDRGEISLLE